MKMPREIDDALFAPCGMNCLVCYKYCNHKKPCGGCSGKAGGKPEHCLKYPCRRNDIPAQDVEASFPYTMVNAVNVGLRRLKAD